MEKGFLPKLYGGLGNQIFIVVSSWVLSQQHGCPLYIARQSQTKNKHSTKDYTRTIFSKFGISVPVLEEDCISGLAWPLCQRKGFEPWRPADFHPGMILDSYFQFYPPLAPFEKDIRSKLLEGLGPIEAMPWAFLHIRRGDYLQLPSFHYIQTIEYYKEALTCLMAKANPEKILVFSDDPEWVEKQTLFQDARFECVKEKDELKSICMMASCSEGAICANSTFSWWGAFLGAYSLRKPVIVPSRWIGEKVYSLFPEEWIVL